MVLGEANHSADLSHHIWSLSNWKLRRGVGGNEKEQFLVLCLHMFVLGVSEICSYFSCLSLRLLRILVQVALLLVLLMDLLCYQLFSACLSSVCHSCPGNICSFGWFILIQSRYHFWGSFLSYLSQTLQTFRVRK